MAAADAAAVVAAAAASAAAAAAVIIDPTKDYLADLDTYATPFLSSSVITPVITRTFLNANGGKFPTVLHRKACPLNETLKSMNKPILTSYSHLYVHEIYESSDYVKSRGAILEFLNQPSNFLDTTELFHPHFLMRKQKEFGKKMGLLDFQLVTPDWDYHDIFIMLDYLHWPIDGTVNTIIKALKLIKMRPVSIVFTRESLIAYKDYYALLIFI